LSTALPLTLGDHGLHIVFPNSFDNELRYGSWRMDRGGPVRTVLVVTTDASIETIAALPHAQLVAYRGRVPIGRRAAAVARLRVLAARGALLTPETQRIAGLLQATAVFALPPTAANRRA
jgi:hypothetical protein